MSDYRRIKVPGACVFFTVCLAERGSDLLVREIGALRAAVRATRAERPFGVDAWVVMPDHLHCLWRLPEGDSDYSVRWGAIKARFVTGLREGGGVDGRVEGRIDGRRAGFSPPLELPVVQSGRYAGLKPGLRVAKREAGIWQRRFWEHHIRDQRDFDNHVRYCWSNPVKHGFVARPVDWPYSSIHRDIRMGRVEAEWSDAVPDGEYGEHGEA